MKITHEVSFEFARAEPVLSNCFEYFEKMTPKLLFVIFSILVLKNQVAGMPIDEEDNGGEFECYVSKKKS